ncbi:septum site-determining protein MinC [Anaerolineales bacterium]
MTNDLFQIKGTKDGLFIGISPTEEWQIITSELAAHIDSQRAFFEGADITIDVGTRPVPKYELSSLRALFDRRGVRLAIVLSDSETTLDSAVALDLRTNIANVIPGREKNETLPIDPEEAVTGGVLVKRTLRSGRTVHSDGHVVVIGDVNPGAKVIAAGDVIIWGKLRGSVHAGADGDQSAIICALSMSPNQLRIADAMLEITTSKNRDVQPKMARLHGQNIVVEVWD